MLMSRSVVSFVGISMFLIFFPFLFYTWGNWGSVSFGLQLVMKPGVKPRLWLRPGIFQGTGL